MTVEELISKLKEHNGKATVEVSVGLVDEDKDWYPIDGVEPPGDTEHILLHCSSKSAWTEDMENLVEAVRTIKKFVTQMGI